MENWILALAASPVVYLGMYLFATIDGFFPPIPSESLAIALAALSVSSGQPNLALIILVAGAGAFTGDQIAYTIGKRLNTRRIPFRAGPRTQKTLDWAKLTLARRGASVILAARYIPVGRVAVNMTAGAVGYPRRRPYRDSHNSRRDDSKTPKVGRSCSSHAATSKSSTATSVWVGSSSPVNSVVVNTAIALCAALDTPEWRYGRASLFGEGSLWTQREIEPPTGD